MIVSRRRRQRLQVALISVFALLFQQLALASYVCRVEFPARPVAQSVALSPQHAACHTVKLPVQLVPEQSGDGGSAVPTPAADQAVCERHCFLITVSFDHSPSLTVPVLPPERDWIHRAMALRDSFVAMWQSAIVPCAAAPPLNTLHCSFQI